PQLKLGHFGRNYPKESLSQLRIMSNRRRLKRCQC
ncbi:MAG: hypothetical protein ACI8PV_001043, partial [Dinoroseobacter sp.]